MSIPESVHLTCPNCRKRLRVAVTAAGKTVRCPNKACQTPFTVSAGTSEPSQSGPARVLSPVKQKVVFGLLAFLVIFLLALWRLASWTPSPPARPTKLADPQVQVEPPPPRVTSKVAFHLVRVAGDDPGKEVSAEITKRIKQELTAAGFEIVPDGQDVRVRVDYEEFVQWYSDDASIKPGTMGWVEHPQTHLQFFPRLRFWDTERNCWFATYYLNSGSGSGTTLLGALRSAVERNELAKAEPNPYLPRMGLRFGKDGLLVAEVPDKIKYGSIPRLRRDHGRGIGRVFLKYDPPINGIERSRESGTKRSRETEGSPFFLEDRLCNVINEAGWEVTRVEKDADLVLAILCTYTNRPCEYKCDLRLTTAVPPEQIGQSWWHEEIAGYPSADSLKYIVKDGVMLDPQASAHGNWRGNVYAPKVAERLTAALKDAEQSLKKK